MKPGLMPLLPMDNDGPLSPAIKQEEYFTTSLLYGIFYDLHSYDLHPNRMCFPDSISRLGMQLPSCCNSVMLARLTRRDPVQPPLAQRLQTLLPPHPRDCRAVSPAYLDSGKALLRAVLDGAPAALGQVPRPVLALRLHHDLQLLPLTLSRVLTTQHWGLLPSSSLLVL